MGEYVYYLLLLLIITIFGISKDKRKALLISFCFITLLASIRKYTVGVDTQQFYRAFSKINIDKTWNFRNFRYEPGFYYFCKIVGRFVSNAQVLIILTSVFINASVYRFIKNNSKDYFLSTILYLLAFCYFSNMNIMRQAIAVAILLYGFEFLKEKKYIKYIITILIASMFHTVAFACSLLLFFYMLPNKKAVYFIEVLIAILTFIFYKQFFEILSLRFGYEGYAKSRFAVSNYFGSLLLAMENLLIILFLLFSSYSKKIPYEEKNLKLYIVAEILYLWFSFLVVRMNIFNRISSLYSIYVIIIIPFILEHMKKVNKSNYRIAYSVILCVYFLSFSIICTLRPEWHRAIPYMFFWS